MKVGIYCRVSTEDQNAETQEKICKKYCNNNNLEIVEIYTDHISGTTESRPAFNKLLNDMRKYRFRGIVVTKLDRIGRSLQHLLSLFDEFKRKKVEFIAVTQNIDTTSSIGVFQMQMLGAFAEFERNIISERVKEALANSDNRHLVGKRGKDKKPRKKRGVLRK